MPARLSRRSAATLIIYFLMITGLTAPSAFFLGKAQGEERARAAGGYGTAPSPFETGLPDLTAETPQPEASEATEEPPVQTAAAAPAATRKRRPSGPLQQAVVRTLADQAEDAGGPSGENSPGDPLSLALAPDLAGVGVSGGLSGPPGFGGPPGILVPNLPSGGSNPPPPPPNGEDPDDDPPDVDPPDDDPPDVDPPVLVTPLPPAAPMLIAGLGGLFAAARRRRT
ncbi:MAG: hypothetical protein R3C58_04560 [Parvularculaceae bacterium]